MLIEYLDKRDAEIAAGIICGCLPLMPALVRHLGLWRSTMARTESDKSNRPSVKASMMDQWGREQHKSHTPGGPYLELSDWSHGDRIATVVGTRARVPAFGSEILWDDQALRGGVDVEHTVPENAIRKTVRMETTAEDG